MARRTTKRQLGEELPFSSQEGRAGWLAGTYGRYLAERGGTPCCRRPWAECPSHGQAALVMYEYWRPPQRLPTLRALVHLCQKPGAFLDERMRPSRSGPGAEEPAGKPRSRRVRCYWQSVHHSPRSCGPRHRCGGLVLARSPRCRKEGRGDVNAVYSGYSQHRQAYFAAVLK